MPKKINNDARTEPQAVEKCRGVEKSYTIEKLDGKIDTVSVRLDETAKRLGDKIDAVSFKTDVLEDKLESVSLKTDVLEAKLDSVSLKTDVLEGKLDAVSLRLDEAVKVFGIKYDELKETFAFFRDDMFSQFDKLFKKLDFHKDEYHSITYGMQRIEDEHKIIDHRTILERLNKLESRN